MTETLSTVSEWQRNELLNLQESPLKLKAVILAGGLGTRLRKVAVDVPKPMVPVMGLPFLEYQIRYLREQGIRDIVLCVSYMADKIKSYFRHGLRHGVNITYSEEDIPLGTAGALRKARQYLEDTFLVVNGDSYTHIDIPAFLAQHTQKKSACTLALTRSSESEHRGVVALDGESRVISFLEKQPTEHARPLISTGVYLFSKSILDAIPIGKNVSLEKEIFPLLVQERKLHGYEYEGYFIDIGRPESYEKFKKDVLGALFLTEHHTVRDALQKIIRNGIDIVLIVDEQKRLRGVVNDKILKEYILRGGHIERALREAMIREPVVARAAEPLSRIHTLLAEGIRYLPIVDDDGRVAALEVRTEKLKTQTFPVLRGRAPMRISFAGGGTDLPYFFEKYGGAVISATIDKYCYATLIKRADKRIIIDSDSTPGAEVFVESLDTLVYDGRLDIIKAVINILQPDFGFEIYLHNDLPPGRGLGASATLSVLVAKMLGQMMERNDDDYKIAEIAYQAERSELKIKGGWQDQYSAAVGGFNFMEFSPDRTVVYPLRLKENTIRELNSHLLLCYTGRSRLSGDVHASMEQSFVQQEKEHHEHENLTKLKQLAIEMKDSLLTDRLEDFGRILRDAWEYKRTISKDISHPHIDMLYEAGLKSGAYGGKLLGAGNGGYLLFFYSPQKRNHLCKALEACGGEILNFGFESRGAEIWTGKNKF